MNYNKKTNHLPQEEVKSNKMTFQQLVELERKLPGRERVDKWKMFVPGQIFHIHSFNSEETRSLVTRSVEVEQRTAAWPYNGRSEL